MKKINYFLLAAMIVTLLTPSTSDAKPFWIKIKIGIFAKWSITTNGECEDGWGICVTLGDNLNPTGDQNLLGYDDATNKFIIKISKQGPLSKSFSSNTFEIREDSQTDPKLIEMIPNFKQRGMNVFFKKGIYKISDEGEYYLLTPEYYLK